MERDGAPDQHTLQCMEIWGGIEPVERTVSTPGLDLWVFSQPYGGDEQGGDVYYVTLCGGGLITRIVVADVSGHGASVAEFSSSLRSMLRKNINQKSQKRLVERLNRQFAEMAESSPGAIGAALVAAVGQYRGPARAEDDVTLIVLHHNASGSPRLSVAQKVDVYAKVFRLKPV